MSGQKKRRHVSSYLIALFAVVLMVGGLAGYQLHRMHKANIETGNQMQKTADMWGQLRQAQRRQ